MMRLACTANMPREEWLALRRSGIGGSDVSALVGLNPYKSAFSVWLDKTGRAKDMPDNEAMRQGRDLEAYVAQRFQEETGLRVRRANYLLADDTAPYMLANVDRLIAGTRAGLECKTMSPRAKAVNNLPEEDVPPAYYCQCQWYMMVTGYPLWYLAILVYGQGFYVFPIERNEDDIAALREAAGRFWREHVVADVPPAPDGSDSAGEAIRGLYPESDDSCCDLTGVTAQDIAQLAALQEAEKQARQQAEAIRQRILLSLGPHEIGSGGGFRVTAKTQRRRHFDSKRFAAAFPDVDLTPFYKESACRPLHIKMF